MGQSSARRLRRATTLVFLALSLGLAVISALVISSPAPNWSDQGHQLLIGGTGPAAERAASLFETALGANPASPYAWADLGDSYSVARRVDEAGRSFERAAELGPSSPPVLLRAGFHWLRSGERSRALRHTSRVLEISSQYDESVFALYRRFQMPRADVLSSGLGENGRAWQTYLTWLIAQDEPEAAAEVWNALGARGWRTQLVTNAYLAYLIRMRRYGQVPLIWEEFAGQRAKGYRQGGVVYDGGFETPETKSPVDWQITPESQGVEAGREEGIAKEGHWSLAVRFPGRSNVAWAGAHQLVVVPPGGYVLRAWLKSDHVTTDHGPQFQIHDADSPQRMTTQTDPVRGTHDWTRVDLPFHVSAETPAVVVSLVRRPSEKIDNKIAGTIWVDGVEIVDGGAALPNHR